MGGNDIYPWYTAVMGNQWLTLQYRSMQRFFSGNILVMGEEHFGGVGLAIDVDEEHLLALSTQTGGQRNAGSCLAGAALAVPVAVWIVQPEILVYRGISGLDSGLFLCAACSYLFDNLDSKRWWPTIIAGLAIALFLGKTSFEFISQSNVFVQPDATFIPMPLAHLAGGLCGCLAAGAAYGFKKLRP